MLVALGTLCVGLVGALSVSLARDGNADSSSTVPPPATTTTTTTAASPVTTSTTTTTTTFQTEPTMTSSEVTSSTSVSDVAENSLTSSNVTTTTTTTAIVTEPKVTTTTKKQTTTKPKTTTTTKVTTTAKPKTTTTTTTTTKKVDDSKYKMTGIMACYDRLRRGVSTAEDRQKIIDDLCQYTINRFDGKSGDIVFERECTSKEASDYFGYAQSQKTTTVEVPIKLEVVDTFNFDNNALLNICGTTQSASWSKETAEEAYYLTLLFQHRLYATAERGIRSYVINYEWNEWGEDMGTMKFYFCIENRNYTTGGTLDWWTVWFLSE